MATLAAQVLKREQTPISWDQIRRVLKNHTTCNFLYLDDLKKNATDQNVFGTHDCVAILVDLHTPAGKETTTRHWVCMIKRDSGTPKHLTSRGAHYMFFDSLGNDIATLSAKTHSESNLLEWSRGKRITYNSVKLQRFATDVNSCGCHISSRLIMKHLSTRKYVNWLKTGNIGDTDLTVSYLCFFDLIK